jgi:Oxidoreductase family, NAD-binding Rossmann fold
MNLRTLLTLAASSFLTLSVSSFALAAEPAKQIRVGIIGLDTSHVTAFTNAINGPKAKPELQALRIVAAFPGGSPDLPTSIDRVAGFTEKVKSYGVEIVDSIDALLPKVDAVLLESVDGRPHLEQARPVIKAGKPLFIDKPAAASLADAIEIYRLANEAGVPVFSCSSLRFSPGIVAMKDDPAIGQVLGCVAYSPCSLDPHHPDLFWYGIHGVEELYTIMGPGCISVSRVHTADTDVATGVWRDGRVGTFRGLRGGKTGYGATVFGTKGIGPSGSYGGYEPMLLEIAKFFQTGRPPVAAAETLEILAFMEAADESKRQNGALVTIESMMEKAKASNAARSAH